MGWGAYGSQEEFMGCKVTEALEGEEMWGHRQDRHQPMTLSQPWAHLASALWKTAFLLWVHVQDEPRSPSQYFTPQLFSEKHPSPKAQFQGPRRDHMVSSAGVRCLLTPPHHCPMLRSHCRLSYRQSSPYTRTGGVGVVYQRIPA